MYKTFTRILASAMARTNTHHHPPLLAPLPPTPCPSPSTTTASASAAAAAAAAAAASTNTHSMVLSVFLAFVLLCAGMSAVYVVYLCLLWFCTTDDGNRSANLAVKSVGGKGLSTSELEKLPKVTGKELVMGSECAVCLDEIESEQPARMVPGCNHGFHLQCADAWLSKRPVCPLCRAKLDPQFFNDSDHNPC